MRHTDRHWVQQNKTKQNKMAATLLSPIGCNLTDNQSLATTSPSRIRTGTGTKGAGPWQVHNYNSEVQNIEDSRIAKGTTTLGGTMEFHSRGRADNDSSGPSMGKLSGGLTGLEAVLVGRASDTWRSAPDLAPSALGSEESLNLHTDPRYQIDSIYNLELRIRHLEDELRDLKDSQEQTYNWACYNLLDVTGLTEDVEPIETLFELCQLYTIGAHYLDFDTAHRIGNPHDSNLNPRTIRYRFIRTATKERIMRAKKDIRYYEGLIIEDVVGPLTKDRSEAARLIGNEFRKSKDTPVIRVHSDGVILGSKNKVALNRLDMDLPEEYRPSNITTRHSEEGIVFHTKHSYLSNKYPAPILHDSIRYPTVEHAYQAYRCYRAGEVEVGKEITDTRDTVQVMFLAQKIQTPASWREEDREQLMEDLLMAKFTQNPQLAIKLLATGSAPLIADIGCPEWGLGEEIRNHDSSQLGKNKLGKALQEIRALIKSQFFGEQELQTPETPTPATNMPQSLRSTMGNSKEKVTHNIKVVQNSRNTELPRRGAEAPEREVWEPIRCERRRGTEHKSRPLNDNETHPRRAVQHKQTRVYPTRSSSTKATTIKSVKGTSAHKQTYKQPVNWGNQGREGGQTSPVRLPSKLAGGSYKINLPSKDLDQCNNQECNYKDYLNPKANPQLGSNTRTTPYTSFKQRVRPRNNHHRGRNNWTH